MNFPSDPESELKGMQMKTELNFIGRTADPEQPTTMAKIRCRHPTAPVIEQRIERSTTGGPAPTEFSDEPPVIQPGRFPALTTLVNLPTKKMKINFFIQRHIPGACVCFLIGLIAAGCASPNVNPPTPRAHTGYVDFFADDEKLYWQVDQIGPGEKTNQVFAQFAPLEEHILRLAFAPGHYQFRVTFMNHAIRSPGVVEVQVQDGMITPVQVTLVDAGEALVQSKEVQGGATYYGRYGRNTRIRDNPDIMYRVDLVPGPALAYKPKAAMIYDEPTDK
jgi:hypothetical protein